MNGSKPPRFATLALATTLLTALLLAGCTGPTVNDAATGRTTFAVKIVNFKFEPDHLDVPLGATVVFTNEDPVGHSVTPKDKTQWGTEGSGDAPNQWFDKGKTWSYTFTKAGTFNYFCFPHPSMVGTIIVGDSASNVSEFTGTDRVVPNPVAPPPTGRSSPAKVHLALEAQEKVAQLADGVGYEFWTFGGTVPGPMLRIRQGDTVDFTLKNAAGSKHPHSVDFHAVTGPGGGAKATQTEPGKETSFSFKALNPGLYVYHCATAHIPTHVANGMYGLILVEPETPLPPVDHEYFVVQGEVYTQGKVGEKGLQAFSFDKMLEERAEYYLLNGRVGALTGAGALQARVNETVRIYFGVGGFVPSSFHVIGEIFDRVWPEGGSTPIENVQTTLVPAGGSTIVEFKVEVPGDYLLVDHWLTHAIDRGAAGVLHVEGPANPSVFTGSTTGSGH